MVSMNLLDLAVTSSVARLMELLAESGEDDYGMIGPVQHAFYRAYKLMSEACSLLGRDFPSSPSVDSEGGVRVTWRNGDRVVKLACPASRDKSAYIFHASPNGNSVCENITSEYLANRLSWLNEREQPTVTSPVHD